MEGGTSGGYNHQRGKAVTDNDYNDKNTTAATTIMRSCSSCNLGVLCRMLTLFHNSKEKIIADGGVYKCIRMKCMKVSVSNNVRGGLSSELCGISVKNKGKVCASQL